jgi:uncharacterized protein with PIN domain
MRPLVLLIGSIIVGLGIVWYFVYAAGRAVKVSLVGEAIAPGGIQARPNGHYRVVVPVDNPETEQHFSRLAAATASGHEHAELVAVNVIEVPRQTGLSQDLRFEHVLGSNIDQIAHEAACEVTLVKPGATERTREVVALVGRGPHSPLAARRAWQFAQSEEDASLTLLNVQGPSEDGEARRWPSGSAWMTGPTGRRSS